MESPQDHSGNSSTVVVSSSPEIVSPGGKSRYGRTRRPKISRDFYNIDDVVIDEKPPPRQSPLKSPKLKPPPKSPVSEELVFEISDEFTKLDDLEMKVANNFKTNLQRGLDDSIKERKFFKSAHETKTEVSNVVDVTKVLKLISTKPTVMEVCEGKATPKSVLKTYCNRRKPPHDNDCFIVESFGLPDEPIIPVNSPARIERNNKIDVDVSCEKDVNLVNPWGFEEYDPVPLYASEPVNTKDEIHYSRGSVLNLFPYDELLSDKAEIDKLFDCQNDTNFEKSRIPPLVVPNFNKNDNILNETKKHDLSGSMVDFEKEKAALDKEFTNKLVSNKKRNKLTNMLKKESQKKQFKTVPTRVLRSNVDNNNTESKTDNSLPSTSENKVINPVKLAKNMCSSEVRVVLNPLSNAQMSQKKKNMVRNPFNIKSEQKEIKSDLKPPNVSVEGITEALLGPNFKALKKTKHVSRKKPPTLEVQEEIDVKNVQLEPIDFQVGDLVWAKIGTHPYWPCMITQEPLTQIHKKFIIHRTQPSYHVRFFGDKGRRSWVSQQYVMLYYAKNDLEKLATILKAENKVKISYIRECYTVKGNKLQKWQMGVDEAEYLKFRSVEDRLEYFRSKYDTKLVIKEEVFEDTISFENQESKSKKRSRFSNDVNLINKKIKVDFNEIKTELVIKEEVPEAGMQVAPVETNYTLLESPNKKLPELSSDEKIDLTSPSLQKGRRTPSKESPHKKSANSTARIEKIIELISPNEHKKSKKRGSSLDELTSPSRHRKNGNRSEVVTNSVNTEEVSTKRKRSSVGEITDTADKNVSERSYSLEKRTRSNKKEEPVPQTPVIEILEDNSYSKVRRKFIREEKFTDEAIQARKKLRSSRNEVEVQETFKYVDMPKIAKRDSTEENFMQEQEEKESKALNKRHQIPGEYSNSDTDSKFSDNSSVPVSLESQAVMFRRNNIFRGIPKERVCQICQQGGEVFKCKGSCNGVYHYKCAMNLPVKEDSVELKTTEEVEPIIQSNEQSNVEIISVGSKKPLPSLGDSPNYKGMSLAEKIDFRMKEIMKKFDYQSVYAEPTDSSSEEFLMDDSFEKQKISPKLALTVTQKPSKKEVPLIKHVTADNISYICVTNDKTKEENVNEIVEDNFTKLKCARCAAGETPNCLVCNKEESASGSTFRQKCSLHQCGKYYHPDCLKVWPQTQWSLIRSTKDKKSDAKYDTFVCPSHVCHTCISDDPHTANSRCSSDKVVKCLKCPATYHSNNCCVPAATEILSSYQIICPRHFINEKSRKRMQQTINTNWCFICSKGGNLICCETCPTSVHIECLPGDLNKDDTFYCEDCQSGRLPLYDEIVWVKLGTFRWWPGLILFPNEVPSKVRNIAHNKGEFVVKFFGTYDHYWVSRGRTFLFQEGDKGHSNSAKKRVDTAFVKAIEEAAAAHELKKRFKLTMFAGKKNGCKPPPYIRIKVNRPVGNVRLFDGNTSNTTSCECDPNQPHPCGPDSDCLNRLLLTECNPEVCPAGERCNNQCFEKREYPPLVPHRTHARGWGLKTLAPIRKGQFVIEYVGELIDEQEYQRRIQKMHEQKEENYYFLTIDKDRMLDAGPKGNVARFMNHSCSPNCETQKWTVNGDTRVGLFANCDIPAETELTFNYNLECIGKEKKICKCGAPNCTGFIGGKVKPDAPAKKTIKPKKKKRATPDVIIIDNPCFICGKMGNVGACNNKICTKYYHLECVGLATWPAGGKWVCSWHNCNICSKRTFRCCIKCVNSYCPSHSQGNVRYDKLQGFLCSDHDPTNETMLRDVSKNMSTDETHEEDDLDSMSLNMRLNGNSSTPLKKSTRDSSQSESMASSSNTSLEKKKKKNKRRLKRRL